MSKQEDLLADSHRQSEKFHIRAINALEDSRRLKKKEAGRGFHTTILDKQVAVLKLEQCRQYQICYRNGSGNKG